MTDQMALTPRMYGEFQKAYDFFNQALFGGQLPNLVITLYNQPRSYGHYGSRFWSHRSPGGESNRRGELNLNPATFPERTDEEICGTLAHEMVHVWQDENGTPGRCGYHNREWAEQMKSVGLAPYNVREPQRETGDGCSHKIVEGGPYQLAFRELAATGWYVEFQRCPEGGEPKPPEPPPTPGPEPVKPEPPPPRARGTRSKFTCPGCGLNAWAKHGARLGCVDCSLLMS
jgi:SprT-like family